MNRLVNSSLLPGILECLPPCRGATKIPLSFPQRPTNARRCPSGDQPGGTTAPQSERHWRGSPPAAGTIMIGAAIPLSDATKAISPSEETVNGPALSSKRRGCPLRAGISKIEEPPRNNTRVPSGENWGFDTTPMLEVRRGG